jgi:hypothetical protein
MVAENETARPASDQDGPVEVQEALQPAMYYRLRSVSIGILYPLPRGY